VQVRTVCREALHIAENIIHPRLPVVGVEALSRCVAERHSAADITDAVPSLFGHQLEFDRSDSRGDVEQNQENVANIEAGDASGTELYLNPAASLSPMESRNIAEPAELSVDNVSLPSEETVTEVVETAALADVDNQNDVASSACGQEKSETACFAASPNSLSPSSRTILNTVTEGSMADETLASTLAIAPTAAVSDGSDLARDKLLDRSQLEPQQSVRKHRYSAASSVNDGDDSESESGEIEV